MFEKARIFLLFARYIVPLQKILIMGFFKSFFGLEEKSPEQQQQEDEARRFDVLKYDGLRALQTRQADHALRCFKAALEIHDDLEIHDYLSQLYIHTDDLHEAVEEICLMAKAQPDNVQILLRLAHVAYMMEDYDLLLEACGKAEALNADNEETLFLYARAYIGKQQPEKAVEYLDRIIDKVGPHFDALLLRGDTLMKMGKTDAAERDADLLLEAVPGHEDVLLLKARICRKKGLLEEARTVYGQVIDANPFCIAAFRERAEVRQALGDEQGAEEDRNTLMELSPDEMGETKSVEEMMKEQSELINPLGL